MGDGGENIARVCSSALDAVPVVDSALARFGINVEVLKVVVKVDGAGAQVPTEECRVGREDGRYVDLPLPGQGQGNTRQPLVEVRNDGLLLLMAYVLRRC
jgi:hypothetical protein